MAERTAGDRTCIGWHDKMAGTVNRFNIRKTSCPSIVKRWPMKVQKSNLLLIGAILTLLCTASCTSSSTRSDRGVSAPVPDTIPWTCTPLIDISTSTSLTRVDPVAQFKAGEIPGERCEDLIWQAEQDGISFEEAVERYAWQSPLSHMVNEIRVAYPDDYAGSRIEEDFTVWIAFIGEAPADAAESIRSFPRDIQIIENRGYTEAGLGHRLGAVYDVVFPNNKVTDAVGTYDLATGKIEITITLDDSVNTPAKKARIVNRILADIPAGRDGTINDVKLAVLNPLIDNFMRYLDGGSDDQYRPEGDAGDPIEPWMLILLVYLAVVSLFLAPFLLYEIPLTATRGQTIGKKLARIRTVRTDNGRTPGWAGSGARWSVLYLPLLIPIIGIPIFLLTAASPTFDRRRRGWHDKIARTATVPAYAGQPTEESINRPVGIGRRLLARSVDWTMCTAAGLALLVLTIWLLGLEGHLF